VGPERKFVGALIIPGFANLKAWAKQQGMPEATNEELIRNPKVLSLYREIIDSYNPQFNHVEQIKRFELLPAEWTVDTGEMTPKLSLRRKVVTEKFHAAIERIYHE
ncbi:MAG TPA: hypothetical protein VNU70_09460, partial [Puia sp.]|nr:hypothetical protein [Puia sp.]